MTQKVRVKSVSSAGTAQVIHLRQSACSGDCHKCSGCGAVGETLELTAGNPIGAKPGDLVTMEAKTGPVLAAAAMLYVLPLLMFFLGYLLGYSFLGKGGLIGCLTFLASIVFCVIYDRRVAAKRETVYTITGFVSEF